MNNVTWILIGAAVYCGIMLTYQTIQMVRISMRKPARVPVFMHNIDGGPKA